MRHNPASRSATISAISGAARSAVTSLTIVAPAASAASATTAFDVSTDSAAPVRARISPSITGTTRSSSTSAATLEAPGRVDSPPMSRIAAPSDSSVRRVRDRARRIEVAAAVGERIRRDVDDPHQRECMAIRVRRPVKRCPGDRWPRRCRARLGICSGAPAGGRLTPGSHPASARCDRSTRAPPPRGHGRRCCSTPGAPAS